jgi:hypothetical protein
MRRSVVPGRVAMRVVAIASNEAYSTHAPGTSRGQRPHIKPSTDSLSNGLKYG